MFISRRITKGESASAQEGKFIAFSGKPDNHSAAPEKLTGVYTDRKLYTTDGNAKPEFARWSLISTGVPGEYRLALDMNVNLETGSLKTDTKKATYYMTVSEDFISGKSEYKDKDAEKQHFYYSTVDKDGKRTYIDHFTEGLLNVKMTETVPTDDYGTWRFVTIKDYIDLVKKQTSVLKETVDMSFMLSDPDFSRNSADLNNWKVDETLQNDKTQDSQADYYSHAHLRIGYDGYYKTNVTDNNYNTGKSDYFNFVADATDRGENSIDYCANHASTHTLNSGENDEVVFVKSWLGNIPVAIENFFGCFGYQSKVSVFSVDGIENLILIFAALLLIFVFPILQAIKIKNEKAYTKYFFTFGVIHNLIMIMMVVFFGKLATRYLLSSVFVCILISARYIYKYWFMQKSVEKYVWITIYGVMTCYLGVVLLLQSIGWTTQLAKEKGFNQQLLDMGITKAYATYWNAYNNQIYSDMKINYAGIDIYGECIKPHKWLVDNSAFEKEDGKSALILDKKENKYIKEHFGYLLDWSIETFKKNGLYVYIYDDDIADEIYNGLEDNKLLPSELLSTGKREKNAYVLNNGDWVYGPYAPIETGSYIVKYQGDNLENVMCDVYCEGKQNAYIEFEEISRNENEVTLRVQFDKEIDSTEFRLCNTSGKETAVLYQIVVERE